MEEEMTWQEKIAAGMELIASGCDDNKSYENCKECPFTRYCKAMIYAVGNEREYEDIDIPETWWH